MQVIGYGRGRCGGKDDKPFEELQAVLEQLERPHGLMMLYVVGGISVRRVLTA